MAKYGADTLQTRIQDEDWILRLTEEIKYVGKFSGDIVFNTHTLCTNFTFVRMKSSDEYIFKCDDCGKEMRLTFGSKGGE
jgi:hypothetical protein